MLFLLLNCGQDETTETQLIAAKQSMNGAMIEAKYWLDNLNKTGYEILAIQNYPSPFAERMNNESKKKEIQAGINRMKTEFGRVKERKFFGVHILLEEKLYTYVPEKMENFKQISPRRLGVRKTVDLYKDIINGTYA
jgi:hypothetical protein